MNIVGALRVRNEGRWLARVLRSIAPLCSHVAVMDDHSEDETREIAANCGAIVHPSPFDGLDETRDKNWLLCQVARHSPDWVLMIDGDEELAAGGCDVLRADMAGPFDVLSMQVLYLWNDERTIRTDGIYSKLWRPSAFRFDQQARFKSTRNGGNFHCGNVPANMGAAKKVSVPLLHFGYMDKADRLRKYDWYRANDPQNRIEDEYRHMVIGDVFPSGSRFRWAGPLTLRAI